MPTPTSVDQPERTALSDRHTRIDLTDPKFQPHHRECLACYLNRMSAYGCTQHQVTRHYRDTTAPRAITLLEQLRRRGACCCECEVFWNIYRFAPGWAPEESSAPDPEVTGCTGVRVGSVQPCQRWEVRRG